LKPEKILMSVKKNLINYKKNIISLIKPQDQFKVNKENTKNYLMKIES
jgi:hypothetical protein